MTVFQFLNNRQLGISREGFRAPYSILNFDTVLSRLTCRKDDVFTVRGEESEVPPFACKFRRDNQCDLLAVANEDGDIVLYDTSEGTQDSLLKSFTAHHNAIFDLCWLPDKCQLVSGSGDHNAALWDINCCKFISIFKKHTASIKTVDVCHEQSAVFATGSRDGNINIWDTRVYNNSTQSKPVVSISQAHCRKNITSNGKKFGPKDPISSVSSVAFQDCNNLASAGVADGVVKIWDLRKTYIPNAKYLPTSKYQMSYSESKTAGHGCTSLVFDSTYKNLYGCSTNSKIFKLDCHSYGKDVVTWYEGFRCATYFVKLALSRDDQYLLCGSSDDKAYIWRVSKPGLPIFQLPGHSAEVTSVCWSSYDITKLATCGDDNKVAIWRVANTETVCLSEDVHAITEPFTDSSKNSSSPTQIIDQNLIITFGSKIVKKSPVKISQTPSKQAPRVITSFFSPVSLDIPTPVKNIQSTNDGNEALNSAQKLSETKSPTASVCSQILTPSNLVNRNNIMNQSPSDIFETPSSPEDKNSSPEKKISGKSGITPPSCIQNKENSSTDFSPETENKTNASQVKRKAATNQSTPIFKRRAVDSGSKSKRPAKVAKKAAAAVGRTIMNYFSVVLSSDD